jgi:hypothetical protein
MNFNLNDTYLYKFKAKEDIKKVLNFDTNDSKMIKTASNGSADIISLFKTMIEALNLKSSINEEELLKKITKEAKIDKSIKNDERSDEIKIASKKLKDSHYQIDLSKDIVVDNGKKIIMVSCYAKDSYLGKYLIKRNYFYLPEREKQADQTYDEILTKMSSLKDRYYNDIIQVQDVSTQMKTILDGVISEIKMEEDTLGATIRR